MKKLILLICFFVIASFVFSQTKPKPTQQKKPAQSEMDRMMEEAMKGMSPEEKAEMKKMMDSMGVKAPTIKPIQKQTNGVTNSQLQNFYDDENRIVPEKDNVRIASIKKLQLTAASVPVFITESHHFITQRLNTSAREMADNIFTVLKTKYGSTTVIGNNAALLWIQGKPQIALALMAKTCVADPLNFDNLSNYAAMLSMCGAEQLAIPLLNYLNARFPKNSTILNNLGQAWFGLGDIARADKYLDTVIRIYAWHPQATLTKSLIEKNKGNIKESTELLKKSIRHLYSEEKEDHLKKAGYKITSNDLRWNLPLKDDGLGMGRFVYPPFPKSVGECITFELEWIEFKKDCNSELARLTERLKSAQATMQQRYNKAYTAGKNTQKEFTGTPTFMMRPPFWQKTVRQQNDYMEEFTRRSKQNTEHWKTYIQTILVPEKNKYDNDMKEIGRRSVCAEMISRTNSFLEIVNTQAEIVYKEKLLLTKNYLSDMLKWNIYTQWPEEFEVTKLNAQITWLQTLKDVNFESNKICNNNQQVPFKRNGKLPDFDEVNCKLQSKYTYGLGTIEVTCTKIISNFDAKFIQLGMEQDIRKNDFGDAFLGCTVKLGIEESIIKQDAGPLRIEAKAGLGFEFEFDRTGLKDARFTSEIKAGIGTDAIEVGEKASGVEQGIGGNDFITNSVEIGVKGKISLISGKTSMEGSGILKKNDN